MRFHHIGYAVQSILDYRRDFFDPLYSPVSVSEVVEDPIQRVRVCFAQLQGGVTVELVEPAATDSPMNGIIGSQRGGLYHQCFEVDDLEEEIARFRSRSCLPLGRPAPAAAFDGRRIIFLLTPQRDLIELLESGR
jgi:methylmalonyl-CoA/ethylmalonyl-CoA epimerase